MSNSKFKAGDRVRSKFYGIVGSVIDVDTDGYIINPDHAEEMWIAEDDAEAYDRKTAFLSDLADVLRKHNAMINVSWNNDWQADDAKYPLIDMDILFNDSVKGICFEDVLGKTLTANNIRAYDKE